MRPVAVGYRPAVARRGLAGQGDSKSDERNVSMPMDILFLFQYIFLS
jgi:hypothetical protein